jgi:hypothetical protein
MAVASTVLGDWDLCFFRCGHAQGSLAFSFSVLVKAQHDGSLNLWNGSIPYHGSIACNFPQINMLQLGDKDGTGDAIGTDRPEGKR